MQLAWPARAPIPRRTSRRGGIGIAVLTAVYAVAAFTGLGSANAPQHFCTLEAGESATLALDGAHGIDTVWYYTGLYTGEYTLAYSDDGITYTAAGTMPQGYADLFKWLQPQPADSAPATAAYVRVTASAHLELGELALLDAQGERIAVRAITGPASAAALCDEADTVPASSTYFNSSYFDEIYHARTAYEHLRGVYPYEVSHPPLGKVILSLGIRLFGMTPLGWRCMGALFGVAMLPLMWDLLRRMFRDDRVALCGTALLAFDFMHLTQTRIATIDSFATLFILLMYLFCTGTSRRASCAISPPAALRSAWARPRSGRACMPGRGSACSGRCTGCFRACRRTVTATAAAMCAGWSQTSAFASCFSCSCRA